MAKNRMRGATAGFAAIVALMAPPQACAASALGEAVRETYTALIGDLDW